MKKILSGIVLALLPLAGGCGGCDHAPQPRQTAAQATETHAQFQEDLLSYAVDNLNRLEEFDAGDMVAQVRDRVQKIGSGKLKPSEVDPLMATCPPTEILVQVVNRLNQWIRTQPGAAGDWKLDPMVATLPKAYREMPMVRDLDKLEFTAYDGFALEEAVMHRDVSQWAAGNELDDLSRARWLFDWTVRNIQLEPDAPQRVPQLPWETLLFGRGTVSERSWVYLLLARQLGVDAVVIALPEKAKAEKAPAAAAEKKPGKQPSADKSAEAAPGGLVHWAIAVVVGDQFYVFEPTLGLPIPAKDGIRRDSSGRLDIRPATLGQLAADDGLLRQLDVSQSQPYAMKAADLKRVTALIEASPPYLSARMRAMESHLAGKQKMVLSASPTAEAERLRKAGGKQLGGVELWTFPYEVLERRMQLNMSEVMQRLFLLLPMVNETLAPYIVGPAAPLYRGRLMHLKGPEKFAGHEGAQIFYQMARPSNEHLMRAKIHEMEKMMFLRGKQDASFWLGLVAFERGNYASASDYFVRRTLDAAPGGTSPWTHAAKYNLARTYEVSDQREKAIDVYQSDDSAPGYHGNLLRAKWLAAPGTRTAP